MEEKFTHSLSRTLVAHPTGLDNRTSTAECMVTFPKPRFPSLITALTNHVHNNQPLVYENMRPQITGLNYWSHDFMAGCSRRNEAG